MTFKEYQKLAKTTAVYPEKYKLFYPVLGLVGEAGEVAEKMKRVFREKEGIVDEKAKEEITKELGDVLWYLAQTATELNISLDRVAVYNIEKLKSRKKRNQIKGVGDNR